MVRARVTACEPICATDRGLRLTARADTDVVDFAAEDVKQAGAQ
jgi:hypothetical protein